ncbi:hypothetical protein [Psychrobacter sp. 72-O-c]|uniref:hypothetical protein n=1 Tax=Psychrobacter sp. 72-O-c TaxID=2774125 RepID=UPI00191851A1|nr:hypothetical protein [Psychrobacter sp. 72-O-c]
MNIHDLSEYQLYKLKSLDPSLSQDWREVIQNILPELDKESQDSVHKNILEPRGIYFDINKGLIYKRPTTLKKTREDIQTHNNDLIAIASDMSKIIDSRFEYYDAIQLADEIEAIFGCLDNLDMRNMLYERKNRKRIQIAFLYDLAQWIDTVKLKVAPGFRKLDSHMVKSYLKEVFIKQKIQGQDFRKWDSSDVSFQEFTYLPPFIRNEGEDRRFFVVEGQKYWFLIGGTDQLGKNPYSFRRFLHEDSSGINDEKYIYLTHVVLKKEDMHDSQYLSHASHAMSRFYTLDRGTPDTLLSFINEIQNMRKRYLKPLLKERLEQVGGSTEAIIKERMITYEKQVSVLILQKIPRIQTILHNKDDQDYLSYHLDKLFKQMIESVQDFRLQPLVMYSNSSEILLIKLMALRKLLTKSHDFILSQKSSIEERSEVMGMPLFMVKEKLNETKISIRELEDLKNNLDNYFTIKEQGSFWKKIALGREPNYTLEEIAKEKLLLKKEVFRSIVRMAKSQNKGMVYIEFECDEIINKNYRHYALADGQLGISRLPRVLRLSEDKREFDIESIRQVVNHNIFEANQLWHIEYKS